MKICAEEIKKHFNDCTNIIVLDTVDSTNNVAKQLAMQGCADKTLVIAEKQTQGRGRMGRSFISNEDNGIYMSLVLRPDMCISDSVYITVMTSVAVCEAVEELCPVECGIKWVNDIYIGNKKVCGILTEAAQLTDKLDYAIVGIGINVTEPEGGFNEEIKDIATSLYEKNAPVGIKNRLIAKILERFYHYYGKMSDKSYMNKYREKSNLIGKAVDVYRGDEIISGVCVDIDENANLVIEHKGKRLTFNSGDARVKRQ